MRRVSQNQQLLLFTLYYTVLRMDGIKRKYIFLQ